MCFFLVTALVLRTGQTLRKLNKVNRVIFLSNLVASTSPSLQEAVALPAISIVKVNFSAKLPFSSSQMSASEG